MKIRQAGSYFSITGVKVGGVQARLEIRELEQQPEMWNLFLLGLDRYKAMDQNDKLSYFQIAGIHGAPFIDWDGVQGSGQVGYCTHGSNLFGTWHRPYLAVFEQILLDRVYEIVDEFPNGPTKDKYRDASSRLRLPYWDWAMTPPNGGTILPASTTTETVDVTFPNGTTGTIHNPLYDYKFHPLTPSDFPGDFPPFDEWPATLRQPSDFTVNATSQNGAVEDVLSSPGGFDSYRSTLYTLFTVYQGFTQFSNKGSGGSIGNLESIHDFIHGTFGSGHMGYVPVAAFDPIFWLHHCNVDRILALWQAVYPDTYLLPYVNQFATYTIAAGTVEDTNSPLTPFHTDSAGDFWTSEKSRYTDIFGYTYPEIQGNPSNDTLKAAINALYAPTTNGVIAKRQATENPLDYLSRVELPTSLGSTYSVRVFLGDFSSDASTWPTDPNLVGSHTSLSSPAMRNDLIVTHSVPLTQALRKRYESGDLKSLDQDVIIEYLKTNLHWRIQQQDLTEIPRDQAPEGLKVTTTSIEVVSPKSASDFPHWVGDFTDHPEISGN
ncbi:Di-copper centre-containing protein [Glonium stellatum]|uniref:tyrosinase n=1 Tax=Glonium stellatum TaxID=574774 RepID=A0A8E2EQ07_9PEZI|nr:Di-copper centre-containing protein [Glonium stellatum]